MTEEELRDMVRESIARQLGAETPTRLPVRSNASNASFALLPLSRGGDGDGSCLIEPAVRCNRCGYCLSYGH
jgi:hypothetical protein